MIKPQEMKGKKNIKASLTIVDVRRNSIFGRYSEQEMIAQLKQLAVDPCRPQFARNNIQPLCNQILRLRKVMTLKDSEIPWRKRKLEQFVKDKLRPPSSFAVPDQQYISQLSRKQLSHASSASCLINSVDSTKVNAGKLLFESHNSTSLLTFDETLPGKPIEYSSTGQKNCDIKHIPLIVLDSDESASASNPPSIENHPRNEARSMEINNVNHHLESTTLQGSDRKHIKPPRRSPRLPTFICDDLQKCVIPVGPRFQVNVPEWTGLVNKSFLINEYRNNYDNSKWLGARVWPVENGSVKSTGEGTIGKGRPSFCSCKSPGSVDCVKRHTLEARLLLQCDLGSAFFSWKFDEMGEKVSKSWTLKDQETFDSIVKRPSSNGKTFLKRALKPLPNKSRKEIINYFFNVYIPNRMSLQTRSSPTKSVDTDDENEVGDSCYLGVAKRSKEKADLITNNSKSLKARRGSK